MFSTKSPQQVREWIHFGARPDEEKDKVSLADDFEAEGLAFGPDASIMIDILTKLLSD